MRLFLLLFCLIGVGVSAEPLRLVFPHFPPYTQATDPGSVAAGNYLIEQIMARLEQEYIATPVPNYKRALGDVRKGLADGFFLASQNDERDEVAVFSAPVTYNNWSWFLHQDSQLNPRSNSFKTQARVASIEGTNTQRWLQNNGYQVVGKQARVVSLAELLFDVKRIDAVFLSSAVFKHGWHHPNLKLGNYIEVTQFSMPFGIYIAKRYLAQNSGFMERLNEVINQVRYELLEPPYFILSLKRP